MLLTQVIHNNRASTQFMSSCFPFSCQGGSGVFSVPEECQNLWQMSTVAILLVPLESATKGKRPTIGSGLLNPGNQSWQFHWPSRDHDRLVMWSKDGIERPFTSAWSPTDKDLHQNQTTKGAETGSIPHPEAKTVAIAYHLYQSQEPTPVSHKFPMLERHCWPDNPNKPGPDI